MTSANSVKEERPLFSLDLVPQEINQIKEMDFKPVHPQNVKCDFLAKNDMMLNTNFL